jgi:hypothetical protein
MIKIAHRGNINGPVPEKENSPDYIMSALDKGYDCEIDLWRLEKKFFLGHDGPQYSIGEKFLFDLSSKLWVHCKNLEALQFVAEAKGSLHGFWHQEDNYTFTSNGYIWTYPNHPTTSLSILVHLGMWKETISQLQMAGICSDFMTASID